ncbi:MAG: EAL domain-containing protein [Ilumatobacteraceae bacterium]
MEAASTAMMPTKGSTFEALLKMAPDAMLAVIAARVWWWPTRRSKFLKVTETALAEDLDQATRVLERLAALGVRVAIDDFGTGWASLTYLKQFPDNTHAQPEDAIAQLRGIARDHAPSQMVVE